MLAPWKRRYDKPRQHIKKQGHHFADKDWYSQSYGFSSSHVRMWENVSRSIMPDSLQPNGQKRSSPGFSVHGILQAIILEWSAISFSRGSSWPRDQTWVSCIAGRFFSNWATRGIFESWTMKKAECLRIDASNCSAGEDSWESLRLQRDQTSQILKETNPEYSLEGLMLKLQYFGHLKRNVAHWKRSWCWERLKAKEGGCRGWDG